MSTTKLLIVEDEARVANFVHKGLTNAGYTADIAENADRAEYLITVNKYDLILLDWRLPGISGLDLCELWRKRGLHTPVIMVTAKDSTIDLINALDKGADDYIIKPFSFDELLARIRAHIRRTSVNSPVTKLRCEDLELDLVKRKVTRGSTEIFLSSREFALLEFLMQRSEKIVSKTEIFSHVWGIEFETRTNLVEVYINHLRKKLDCGSRIPLIHTVKGVGYVLKKFE